MKILNTISNLLLIGQCAYIQVRNAQRTLIRFHELWVHTEECTGKQFVIAGSLKHFASPDNLIHKIKSLGGHVTEQISSTTDYLICNDLHSPTSQMTTAKELSIPVLSEAAFIRRFCNMAEFSGIKDLADLFGAAWEMTYTGSLPEFVMENGLQPVQLQIWKDGRWA